MNALQSYQPRHGIEQQRRKVQPAPPSIASLGGSAPDLTGALSTDEYINRVRGKPEDGA